MASPAQTSQQLALRPGQPDDPRSPDLLSAARRALAEVDDLPTFASLIARAEVIRVAARAAGLSTEAQNDWTRYKVDCERAAAEMITRLREAGELASHGQRANEMSEPPTSTLDILKVKRWQAAEWAKLAALDEAELDDFFAKKNKAGKAVAESVLIKLGAAKQTTKRRRDASRNAAPLPDGMDLRVGDCREVLAGVEPDSVALVLTDPPYGDEAEPLYEWLAKWSAQVLIPGGSLICYTGQSRLDRDMRLLGDQLRYWWLLAMKHNRAQRLPGKFVIAEFKPVLWYVKDNRRGRSLVPDMLISERDKSLHPWSQGTAGAVGLIEHLTEPGELIADPFAGTALWGRSAARMGRRWVGADVVDGGDSAVVA
jgi:hypothetical protein